MAGPGPRTRHLTVLAGEFAVCRLPPTAAVPAWALPAASPFTSVTRTAQELSVIGPAAWIPSDVDASRGWSCLRVDGPFALDEPGVLHGVVAPLATAGISVFAVATHDTDHLLVTELGRARRALTAAGHRVDEEAEP